MANVVLKNAFISIAGNDVSGDGNEGSIEMEIDLQGNTTFGDNTESSIPGLKDWTVNLGFVQNFANAQLDSILFPLFGTVVAFEIRPDAGAVSTSNPKYTGDGVLTSYNPLGGGALGDVVTAGITLRPSKNGAGSSADLARATS